MINDINKNNFSKYFKREQETIKERSENYENEIYPLKRKICHK